MTKQITRMEIDDAEHYTPEQRQAIIDTIQRTNEKLAPGEAVSRWELLGPLPRLTIFPIFQNCRCRFVVNFSLMQARRGPRAAIVACR
jgi:hypothetical protein